MAEGRDRNLLTLTMDGAEEHQGHVMAHALTEKLDQFLKTFSSFERTYIGSRTRQTDFEIVILSHNSPTEISLNPVPRGRYYPTPIVNWTMEQWDHIARGERLDNRVTEDMIADLATLARKTDKYGYSSLSIRHAKRVIVLNDTAVENAQSLKAELLAARPRLPWRIGVSAGSVIGELQSVLNADGERQIVICPFIGPSRIKCQFTDEMREQIRTSLFNIVRINGLMHYKDESPHPTLIEVEGIEPITLPDNMPHILDGAGLFKEGVYARCVNSEI